MLGLGDHEVAATPDDGGGLSQHCRPVVLVRCRSRDSTFCLGDDFVGDDDYVPVPQRRSGVFERSPQQLRHVVAGRHLADTFNGDDLYGHFAFPVDAESTDGAVS